MFFICHFNQHLNPKRFEKQQQQQKKPHKDFEAKFQQIMP